MNEKALKNNNKNSTVKTNPEIFAEKDKLFHIRHHPANFLNTQGSRSFSEDTRNLTNISRMIPISSEKKGKRKIRKYHRVPDTKLRVIILEEGKSEKGEMRKNQV